MVVGFGNSYFYPNDGKANLFMERLVFRSEFIGDEDRYKKRTDTMEIRRLDTWFCLIFVFMLFLFIVMNGILNRLCKGILRNFACPCISTR